MEKTASLVREIPDDVIMDCIAPRVPRSNHPMLSLVSKQLRSLVASRRHLYMRRSILGCTEQCVYVLVTDNKTDLSHWYTLYRRTNRNIPGTFENRLVRILSLPPMPKYGTYAVLGSKIFVMGGVYGKDDKSHSSITLCIDCQTHTARRVANMPIVVIKNTSMVVEEKIYLIGRPPSDQQNMNPKIFMVFDSRTETWDHDTKPISKMEHMWYQSYPTCEGGLKIIGLRKNINYIPREKWGTPADVVKHYRLSDRECFMGNVLYAYDNYNYILRTYDLKKSIYGVVKGLDGKLPLRSTLAHIVRCGNKLILFLVVDPTREIWCVEITVEKRQGGEIWGNVESCHLLFDGPFYIPNCFVVTL